MIYREYPRIIDGKDTKDKEQFDELFREYKRTGNPKLRELLLSSSMPIVINVAKRYRSMDNFDDLVEDGVLGLINCFDNHYDPEKASKNGLRAHFYSYAAWYIRQAICLSLGNFTRMIRIPIGSIQNLRHLEKARDDFRKERGRNPALEELSTTVHISLKNVKELLSYSDTISLNEEFDDGNSSMERYMTDPNSTQTNAVEQRDLVDRILRKADLTDYEKKLLFKRFGLNGERYGMTLEELGLEYKISRERVRQKLGKIIKKIQIKNNQQKDERVASSRFPSDLQMNT